MRVISLVQFYLVHKDILYELFLLDTVGEIISEII